MVIERRRRRDDKPMRPFSAHAGLTPEATRAELRARPATQPDQLRRPDATGGAADRLPAPGAGQFGTRKITGRKAPDPPDLAAASAGKQDDLAIAGGDRVVLSCNHAAIRRRQAVAVYVAVHGRMEVDIGPTTPESRHYPEHGAAAACLAASGNRRFGVILCGAD